MTRELKFSAARAPRQPLRDEMLQFVDAVLNDKATPTTGEDGLNSILVALAAKKSVAEGRPVKISEIA